MYTCIYIVHGVIVRGRGCEALMRGDGLLNVFAMIVIAVNVGGDPVTLSCCLAVLIEKFRLVE